MTGKQQDLTRAEALQLAQAKWGELATVRYGAINGYRVGRYDGPLVAGVGLIYWEGCSASGWREACVTAGLLSAPVAR